jgi:hypothetical protein
MPVTVEEPLAPEGHRPRRRWTADEDARLIAAVNKYGSQRGPGSQWSKISAGLPGRTNKDCRKRWFHSLDPRVRKGRWSPDEDELLRKLYAELGPQWKAIAIFAPRLPLTHATHFTLPSLSSSPVSSPPHPRPQGRPGVEAVARRARPRAHEQEAVE